MVPQPLAQQLPRQVLPLEQLGVHANHEHLLVVAAVEDADVAARRQGAVGAPKEVVCQFLGSRRLEAGHLHALRVHARHHVLDGAVLAGGVHRLEHAQHRPFVLRVEPLLQCGEPMHVAGDDQARLRLGQQMARRVCGSKSLEPEALAGGHAVAVEDPPHLPAGQVRSDRGVGRGVHERSPWQRTRRAQMKSRQPL